MERSILRRSKGEKVSPGDRIFVRYEGKLTDNTTFDSNFQFSSLETVPERDLFSFVLGENQVIQGWEQGLKGSRLGEVVRLVIPPELAYGDTERQGIPANSTLDFTVEIVGFNKGNTGTARTYKLEDIGINLASYGIKEKSLKKIVAGKVGLDTSEQFEGTDGIDFLTGLRGNNLINGGLSGDILISTKGADVFAYNTISDSLPGKSNRDLIGGFNKRDRIDLTAIGEDVELTFVGKKSFTERPGEIRYSNGVLAIDLTGNRKSDFEIEFTDNAKVGSANLLF